MKFVPTVLFAAALMVPLPSLVAFVGELDTAPHAAHVDTDESKNTKLEDVVIDSRWNQVGAGRADIDIAGGDLPSTTPMVDAVECWGTDFLQSYYSDSVGFSPNVGVESACVYPSK